MRHGRPTGRERSTGRLLKGPSAARAPRPSSAGRFRKTGIKGQKPRKQLDQNLGTAASFQWRANKPSLKRKVSGSLRFDLPLQGAPADPAVFAVLNNPGPPFHNDIAHDAVPIALANHLNKRDGTKRGLLIAKDFFL